MKTSRLAPLVLLGAACGSVPPALDRDASSSFVEVVLASEVDWEQLNPARGDKSPKAGTLWGDRKGVVATGYLIRFEDGFRSPPHIHNVSYRGVVIRGLVHNDDPDAAPMWMPSGSFWTQPKGEVHVTAAKGENNLAYIEIDSGPYLVWPTARAFDSGERPVNVDPSNIVWMDAPAVRDGARVSYLWGELEDDRLRGAMIRLPRDFAGTITSHAGSFRAVVIHGELRHRANGTSTQMLQQGSYVGADGASTHHVTTSASEAVLYIRTDGEFEVRAAAN